MDSARRINLIERYQDVVRAVVVAFDHLDEEHLDLSPTKGAWSARQVVHHLADSELYEGLQLRRMLAENKPVLVLWDDQRYAERLHYERPVDVSLDTFRATALSNIELLRSLTEEQWRREGNQQKPWPLTIDTWLEANVNHIRGRLMQILNAPTGGRVIADP